MSRQLSVTQDAFGWPVHFRDEGGVYADVDAGGMLIGILSKGAAKALSFPVEPISLEVCTAGSATLGGMHRRMCGKRRAFGLAPCAHC